MFHRAKAANAQSDGVRWMMLLHSAGKKLRRGGEDAVELIRCHGGGGGGGAIPSSKSRHRRQWWDSTTSERIFHSFHRLLQMVAKYANH